VTLLTLSKVKDILRAEPIFGAELLAGIEVDSCYSADLMSDVLGRAKANGLMLTGLTNPQAVRTAEVADIKAVCIVRGKKPETLMVELAREKNIPLLVTKLTMFEACGLLYQAGLRGVPE
jgi:predicted transcriptional regulator